MTKEFNDLHTLLIDADKDINNTINKVYKTLLSYLESVNADDIAADDKYIIDAVKDIIYNIEVSENYNKAFKLIDSLGLELSANTCKHSYIE